MGLENGDVVLSSTLWALLLVGILYLIFKYVKNESIIFLVGIVGIISIIVLLVPIVNWIFTIYALLMYIGIALLIVIGLISYLHSLLTNKKDWHLQAIF